MSRLALLVFLLGCGGPATPASAPAPAVVMVAQPGVDPPPPPPPAAPAPDPVALDNADPCMGGEATGMGGAGTAEGTIGIGHIGTSGHGIGAGATSERRRPTPSTRVTLGTPTVSGRLDKDVIERIVRRHLVSIRFCYEKQLQLDPDLQGRLTAKWTITTEGTVDPATASGLHAELAACVARQIKRWRFPKPTAGVVTVSYPFQLTLGE